jgi:hypothetical protein
VLELTQDMDALLAPLEELEELSTQDLTPEKLEVKIPIPSPTYLLKQSKLVGKSTDQPMVKYAKEYDAYARWAALPKEERKPKTAVEWERKNKLPKGYTQFFRQREDFSNKRLTYFWEWMMDIYPEVVYAVYQRATAKKGSDKAAGIFIDLLSKKMNMDKPRVQVQPMVLMGVQQEKIDALFTPQGYANDKLIPEKK